MKKITNKEEANFYFKKVNELVDDYIKNHKIRPNEIYDYVNRNYESFLEEIGLNEIDGIKVIVNNVLEHRLNIMKDRVMKFENFSMLKENVLQVSKVNVEHEKILADHFNTSLGHIDVVDDNIHLFLINDFGEKRFAVIFSDEEINEIKSKILNDLLEESKNRIMSITELDNKNLGFSLRFWLGDVIDETRFNSLCNEKLTKDNLLKLILNLVSSYDNLPVNFELDKVRYHSVEGIYHIWELS